VVEGVRSEAVVRRVDERRIGIRFGDFYARRLIEALGLDQFGGVVRVSFAHYNTLEEVDRLIAALDQAITALH
jgi:selenocysteine lyase/cysteine desulfurase